MPQELVRTLRLMCYGANELKYWSTYSADGRERYCMTFGAVPVDSGGKRAIRIFGGRRHVPRAANGGRCEPESCAEYQARQCNLTGRFIFLIPGVASIQPIELATNSFYAMNAARQTLETVGYLRGGRIDGCDAAGVRTPSSAVLPPHPPALPLARTRCALCARRVRM